uniref:YrbL family protein n=1 Tax=Methylophaga sp. TaxID=2024840 RepID=UPI003F6951ED
MLQLTKEQLIGKGWHRECYQHPEDRHLCIKVVVNGDDTETKREQAYYRHLGRHLTNWEAIPRFYENVSTNLGQGAVFDLIHDNDGSVSKTLGYYLEEPERFQLHKVKLKSALAHLK